jgi:hypothetical protein
MSTSPTTTTTTHDNRARAAVGLFALAPGASVPLSATFSKALSENDARCNVGGVERFKA